MLITLNTEYKFYFPPDLSCLFTLLQKATILIYTTGIMHFQATVDGCKKSQLEVADVQNDDLLFFCMHTGDTAIFSTD